MSMKIFVPTSGHKGDSFRELIQLWMRDGFVEIFPSPDRYVWLQKPGTVLLYDYDLVTDFGGLPSYEIGLFGNQVPVNSPNSFPWIMWGRHPYLVEQMYAEMNKIKPKHRMWKSLFVGKVENDVQFKNRFQTGIDWSKHIQNFTVVKGAATPYPYSPVDYLYNMSRTQFAFLLPGYGPKCNRDIEAMAMGAIPVVTPGVSTEYYRPWVENVNYVSIQTEQDIESLKKLEKNDTLLEKIQRENYKWYLENCSSKGSFETTLEIIQKAGYTL